MRLAVHLGVPPSFISKMASGEKSIPLQHMSAIEAFTGGAVSRKDMRPDDWPRIWPELAEENTHA
jgi:DNA-binding transcriptional regulator YdaS (Cro superfamily)